MDVRLIVLLLLLVSSCMPTASVTRGNSAASSGDSDGTTTSTPTSLTWNYLGSVDTTITIDSSNLNTAYLVGTGIETFLATSTNFTDQNYCLSANFVKDSVTYDLRARVVPISYYDFTLKRTVRVFRVDFPDTTNSSTFCSGTLFVPDASSNYVADTTGAVAPVFAPNSICPTCTSALTSARVRVFKRDTTLNQILPTSLNFSSLVLKIDPNANTASTGTCTNSSCVARGYDCCLETQCVNDGSTRPSAYTTYASLLTTAEAERLQNPLAYLNYPQLYYICGTTPTTTSGSTTGTTTSGSGSGYDAAFELLKKDYACIKSLKAQSTISPWNQELLTRTSWVASTDCLTASSDSSSTSFYRSVVSRLYDACECNMSLTLNERITTCPAYEYQITSGTEAAPLQIDCYTPPSTTTPLPSQQTITLSTRAAPHRFFDSAGTERTLPLSDSSVTQEGASFSYQDSDNVFPVQSNFSMNAILGQMSIALDKAQPAKTVTIDLDQVYFIQATSGTYTPCPACSEDSWFTSFSPYPSSSIGKGVQAAGFSTTRDEYGDNSSLGNYEDTIFGRACWIPPTMIPFSEAPMTSVVAQRQNRLQTQAALFINGYQRDWFGFNKGALIGSFDGVSWFAIGNGRIVRSTSKKLFLAINAPFADVANNSSLAVNILAYDGTTQAAQVDYDPAYHQTHALQNQAGNCQMYHQCTTDTDCVTRLGWEYACADVKDTKTNWPTFDTTGAEISNADVSPAPTIANILAQKSYPSSNTRRCVYRGAGALCLRNATAVTDLNKKKVVSCAPNFYCQSLSGTAFNGTVARFAAQVEDLPISRNHLFGRDANVLGRPLNYLSGSSSVALPSMVTNTLVTNMALTLPGQESLSTLTNTGLCLPGKALPTTVSDQATMANPFNQALSADPSKRTDFISQIGSCNSVLFTSYRHSSCPVIGADLNYAHFATTTIADTAAYSKLASNQNACGLETLLTGSALSGTADTIANNSPFRTIEAKVLANQVITEPTLARDACLRRAGAVCNTDLDCSPNKFHSEQEDIYGLNYFGNQAEKDYYDQYLICGQTDPKPNILDANYSTYDMKLNRCCREVGSEITTYTPYTPAGVGDSNYTAITNKLKTNLVPGVTPTDALRYTRFATVEALNVRTTATTVERPILSAYQDISATSADTNGNGIYEPELGDVQVGGPKQDAYGSNVFVPKQWKTLNESNSETCCGGGWIRKFAAGQSWEDRNRLSFDVTNFRCINSRTPLITNPNDVALAYADYATPAVGISPQPLVDADYGDYCKDGTNTKGSCAQYSIANSLVDTAPTVDAYGSTVVLNTLSPNYSSSNLENYFSPRSADGDSATFIDYSVSTGRRNIKIRIPSFVPKTDFDNLYVNRAGTASVGMPSGLPIALTTSTGSPTISSCSYADLSTVSATTNNGSGVCASGCCVDFNMSTRILTVVFNSASLTTQKAGITITVRSAGNVAGITRTRPGTSAYYLKRLGRLELSGVPQISFEPLYCNDNANRVVPGIFRADVDTRAEFQSSAFSYAKSGSYYTNSSGLQTEQIFSSSEFKCCAPLGKTVTDSARCCSAYVKTTSGVSTCSLPPGTDLMVYFNRYISNEGVGTDKPGGGLLESDFDQLTGEPLLTTAINSKLNDLGVAYCSSKKVRQGAAFGGFEPQPAGSDTTLSDRIYGIVDSTNDVGQVSNAGATIATGYTQFGPEFGFRWNHHLYCAD